MADPPLPLSSAGISFTIFAELDIFKSTTYLLINIYFISIYFKHRYQLSTPQSLLSSANMNQISILTKIFHFVVVIFQDLLNEQGVDITTLEETNLDSLTDTSTIIETNSGIK